MSLRSLYLLDIDSSLAINSTFAQPVDTPLAQRHMPPIWFEHRSEKSRSHDHPIPNRVPEAKHPGWDVYWGPRILQSRQRAFSSPAPMANTQPIPRSSPLIHRPSRYDLSKNRGYSPVQPEEPARIQTPLVLFSHNSSSNISVRDLVITAFFDALLSGIWQEMRT